MLKQKIINYAFLVFVLIVIFFIPNLAIGEKIVVGMDPFPPWQNVKNGKISGVDVELLKEIARRLKTKFTFEEIPWKRALVHMKEGKIDILCRVRRSPDRESYMHFIELPIPHTDKKVFYVNKGNRHFIKTYNDLYKYTIGVKTGHLYFAPFDTDSKIDKYEVTDEVHSFKQLHAKRIDAVLVQESVGETKIKKAGLQGMFEPAIYTYVPKKPTHFTISRKSILAKQLPKIHKIMKQLKKDGTLTTILNEYLDKYYGRK